MRAFESRRGYFLDIVVSSNIEQRGEIGQENRMLNGLKSIGGHVGGIQHMVEEDKH